MDHQSAGKSRATHSLFASLRLLMPTFGRFARRGAVLLMHNSPAAEPPSYWAQIERPSILKVVRFCSSRASGLLFRPRCAEAPGRRDKAAGLRNTFSFSVTLAAWWKVSLSGPATGSKLSPRFPLEAKEDNLATRRQTATCWREAGWVRVEWKAAWSERQTSALCFRFFHRDWSQNNQVDSRYFAWDIKWRIEFPSIHLKAWNKLQILLVSFRDEKFRFFHPGWDRDLLLQRE